MSDVRQGAKRFLEEQIKQCELSVRAHQRGFRLHQGLELAAGLPIAVLSVVAGATFFAQRYETMAAVLSLVVACLAATRSYLKPEQRAAYHRGEKIAWASLKRDMQLYLTTKLPTDGDAEVQKAVEAFAGMMNKETSPEVPADGTQKVPA